MDEDFAARMLVDVTTILQRQQKIMERMTNRPPPEKKVEGISMPHYDGMMRESLELFLDQARPFFEANNIDCSHDDNRKRVLAMTMSNLRGLAAAWYITQQGIITNIGELAVGLRKGFIPVDMQERLRDALYSLKQREMEDLLEYVPRFCQLVSRVEGMGKLDKIMLFNRSLVTRTHEDVVYRRCSTVHDVITVPMEFESAHLTNHGAHRGGDI